MSEPSHPRLRSLHPARSRSSRRKHWPSAVQRGTRRHYHHPTQFCTEYDDNPWTWIDDNGEIQYVNPMTKWGTENDYNDMISNLETIKKTFINKGIPAIITEVFVLTEQKKEPESIREYLNAIFSIVSDYNGIMSCLWDTSKKTAGDINFYNRESDQWYDEKIKENFRKIGKGKYIKPTQYFYITKFLTVSKPDPDGFFSISIGRLKVIKIIFNAKIAHNYLDCVFGIASYKKNGQLFGIPIEGVEGKKNYDGSYSFFYDTSNEDFNVNIQIQKWKRHEFITINYLTIELEKSHFAIKYKEYKNALLNQ